MKFRIEDLDREFNTQNFKNDGDLRKTFDETKTYKVIITPKDLFERFSKFVPKDTELNENILNKMVMSALDGVFDRIIMIGSYDAGVNNNQIYIYRVPLISIEILDTLFSCLAEKISLRYQLSNK